MDMTAPYIGSKRLGFDLGLDRIAFALAMAIKRLFVAIHLV